MVPITSAGSRSGVNWIRENAMRRHSATVRTAKVLASPGTPSSSTCPPVSSPMSRRSTISSCATTRFATSCAIALLNTASPVLAVRVVISAPPPPLCAPPAHHPPRLGVPGEHVQRLPRPEAADGPQQLRLYPFIGLLLHPPDQHGGGSRVAPRGNGPGGCRADGYALVLERRHRRARDLPPTRFGEP